MHRLRSSSTVGRWAVALGLLLIVGPLVQSITPCRGGERATNAASVPIVTTAVPSAQWSCPATDAGAMLRAASTERSMFSLDGPLGGGVIGPASTEPPSVFLDAPRPPSPPPVSPALEVLRPVVLQI
ncbi:hypothetical protein [Salinibacter grassmerensis]|uniref:hypothetical protein n=1 Tax=Salinibacter grassmerensis TaxID=3040353 RepID=UPI0021E910A0|nr:hypothetical protein [Salinibacter grassmerensis]